MSTSVSRKLERLSDLVPLMGQAVGFPEVAAALARGDSAAIDGAWGSSSALVAAALAAAGATPAPAANSESGATPVLLVVLPRISEVDDYVIDLAGFSGQTPLVFPAWESVPRDVTARDPVFSGRIRALRELTAPTKTAQAQGGGADRPKSKSKSPKPGSGSQPAAAGAELSPLTRFRKSKAPAAETVATVPLRLVVTSFPALLHPVPDPAEFERMTRRLRVGETLDPEEFLRWLLDLGFERVKAVELPGEFTMHGGILDLFPPAETDPLRLEFFGDELESIRRFDVQTQKKIEDLTTLSLVCLSHTPVANEDGASPERGGAHFVEALPPGSWIALGELLELRDEGRHYLDRLDNPRGFYSVEATLAKCVTRPTVTIAAISGDSAETSCHLQIQSVERFEAPAAEVMAELTKVVGRDETVVIACHNEGERTRLGELVAATDLATTDRVRLCEGYVLRGFRMVGDRLIVLSDHELFGRRDIRRTAVKRAQLQTRAIDSFLELNPGDLVVHLTKGIARFRGMELLTDGDQQEEHLALEFRDEVKVFVPVSLIHLVQKYVGAAKTAPVLSKVGGQGWERRKAAAAEAVADLACDMIRLQAERAAKPGLAFPPDSHWQQEFEAAFPYTETDDQVTSIAAIKDDMQRPRPMDRLICGDVGYGKTEVSMRGAFKAIDAGKQVAVLVPTTVLAEQHYRTFCERMAEYPFTIEVLSRFRTKGEQRKILEGLKQGSVDLVIGTHRIVQPDVQFHDLGLLIIDEEQRFGVEAKDRLKQMRLEVDVLTLSATPIPRTLHLSLLGIRDISNLQTPPHDRLSIETRITRFDTELIRQGIVRELNRAGQVYFVHNRVYNIQSIADRLQSIVPEARIGIVHGQMGETELEDSMVKFVNGQLDVLVATTIIESGLDIPNANTVFIHQADKYGLADLHQLRGRVGRYKHRAYCYLLLEEGQTLSSTAAKRLKAIEEFSELGAGFKIAMRDLEIRGAGNILGTEQSGHIASVGYELYCQLLENAVRRMKNEPLREVAHVAVDLPVSAYLPGSYVPPGRPKIEVYRRLSQVDSLEQLQEFETELVDRFGPVPEMAHNLLELKHVQLLARHWQIDNVHLEDEFLVLEYRKRAKIEMLAQSCRDLRIVDERSAYLPLPAREKPSHWYFARLKTLLQPK